MMIGWGLLLALAGVILSAFFAGTETGFYRATRLRLLLDALAADSTARGLLFLTNHPSLFVATALVGNSVAAYMISLATVIVVGELSPEGTFIVELLSPLVVAPVVLVYGELLPKNLFLAAPNRLLRATGPLFLLFVVLFFPLAGLLWLLGRFVAKLTNSSPEPVRLVLAQRELRQVLAEGHDAGILHPAQQSLAHGIFAVARKPVKQFVTPLSQMLIVRSGMSKPAVLRLAEQTRTAIIPVAAADGSNRLIGCVRVIDLRLRSGDDLAPLRPLPEIRDDATHLAALTRLENSGEGLAQVVNAKGEAIGIVLLERLREPLF
jgi:CBS domain containing-hemolysin-like protein